MNITRNRIINFRVSEEEFRRLKSASDIQNARCLSDFARAAILRVAADPDLLMTEGGKSDLDLPSLARRLSILEATVARLAELFAPSKNGGASEEPCDICSAAQSGA